MQSFMKTPPPSKGLAVVLPLLGKELPDFLRLHRGSFADLEKGYVKQVISEPIVRPQEQRLVICVDCLKGLAVEVECKAKGTVGTG